MIAFILAHPITFLFAAYWLFSAFVSGMPEPSPISSVAYRWLFHSLNFVSANVFTVLAQRFPWLTMFLPKRPTEDSHADEIADAANNHGQS